MRPRRSWLTNPWLHLAVILVVASLFRLWQIHSLPPGLFGDEATDGLDALDVLAGRGEVFFPANFGREGLHIWLVAAAFRLWGVTPLALRLPSALAGILTALATYWLGRELLANTPRIGPRAPHHDACHPESYPPPSGDPPTRSLEGSAHGDTARTGARVSVTVSRRASRVGVEHPRSPAPQPQTWLSYRPTRLSRASRGCPTLGAWRLTEGLAFPDGLRWPGCVVRLIGPPSCGSRPGMPDPYSTARVNVTLTPGARAPQRPACHPESYPLTTGNPPSISLEGSVARPIDAPAWVPSLVSLAAALYVSTSYAHVHFSRFGIRGVFTPLCGALAFAAFWRAVNLRRREASPRTVYAWFAVSGFCLGLSLHFYTASRFYPFFLAGFLLLQWGLAALAGQRGSAILPRNWRGIVLLYLVAAVVFAPLGVYFLQHPGSFTQRASQVVAFGNASPWSRIEQAVVANVLQFFVPGRGDTAQFYNLPGRPLFDALTAALALAGMGVLLFRWRRPAALFLLAWWPALLLPSFLATDRLPTLPRVLGALPGVYFFPAVGAAALATALGRGLSWLRREAPTRPAGSFPALAAVVFLVALSVHAGLTFRDYFLVWGRSQATFDAFEGDMTAAWQWLAAHQPAVGQPPPHVYLSADIYRHPTFMLLHEQATVVTYFTHEDPGLSWFDGRSTLPQPPGGQPAVYLVGASAPLGQPGAAWLADRGAAVTSIPAPGGSPALTIIALPAGAAASPAALGPVYLSDRLAVTGAEWTAGPDGKPVLQLAWQTGGAEPQDWAGYRLEIEGQSPDGAFWRLAVPFDSYRSPEWVAGGGFLSWHTLKTVGSSADLPHKLRIRLIRASDDQPVVRPEAPDGWHDLSF